MKKYFTAVKIRAAAALAVIIIMLTGCSASLVVPTALIPPSPRPAPVQAGQFDVIDKDGVEIACPKNWSSGTETDTDVVYDVSRAEFIRITVGVLPALQQSYYNNLVSAGTVQQTKIDGYPGYKNEYRYDYRGSQLVNECYTAVQGDKACHIMILCDTELQTDFQPVFDYVLNSLRFK